MTVWNPVPAAHLSAVTAWVGGMFHALAVLRPSLAVLEPPRRVALHVQAFRRFFLAVCHAMPVALLSGYAMLFGVYGGFRGAPWTVHAMQETGLVMAAVFVGIVFGPYAALKRQPGPGPLERVRKLILLKPVPGVPTITVASLGHRG